MLKLSSKFMLIIYVRPLIAVQWPARLKMTNSRHALHKFNKRLTHNFLLGCSIQRSPCAKTHRPTDYLVLTYIFWREVGPGGGAGRGKYWYTYESISDQGRDVLIISSAHNQLLRLRAVFKSFRHESTCHLHAVLMEM
jgi:hypothetical protein